MDLNYLKKLKGKSAKKFDWKGNLVGVFKFTEVKQSKAVDFKVDVRATPLTKELKDQLNIAEVLFTIYEKSERLGWVALPYITQVGGRRSIVPEGYISSKSETSINDLAQELIDLLPKY